jgi:hypothetical protein
MKFDYYAVLGVLPDAENVVVTAAYRALASLYHPDRWKGNIDEATKRMAEINVAYGVLGDTVKRQKYDSTRPSRHANFSANEEAQDAAFDEALGYLEQDWLVATEIYPDLSEVKNKLSRTSHKLAFAYVTVILSSKRFKDRQKIAELMESEFLSRYFGDHPKIVAFAKELIYLGLRDAVKKLNRFVDVLGSEFDDDAIIRKITKDFGVKGGASPAGYPYGITCVGDYYVFEHEMFVRLADAVRYAELMITRRNAAKE